MSFGKNGRIEAGMMIDMAGAETVVTMCIALETFENGRTRRVTVKEYSTVV